MSLPEWIAGSYLRSRRSGNSLSSGCWRGDQSRRRKLCQLHSARAKMLNHAGERRNYQSSYWLDEAPGGLDPREFRLESHAARPLLDGPPGRFESGPHCSLSGALARLFSWARRPATRPSAATGGDASPARPSASLAPASAAPVRSGAGSPPRSPGPPSARTRPRPAARGRD